MSPEEAAFAIREGIFWSDQVAAVTEGVDYDELIVEMVDGKSYCVRISPEEDPGQ